MDPSIEPHAQATAWVKTQSEKKYAPTLKAKAQQAAAATAGATAAGAVALSSSGAAAAAVAGGNGKARRFGGGELWEGFVEEFSDLLDTDKYAAQVAARAQRRAEKEAAKGKGKGQGKAEAAGAGGGGKGSEQDDARRLLVFLWVAILCYGLQQLWRDMEEEEADRPNRKARATAAVPSVAMPTPSAPPPASAASAAAAAKEGSSG